MPYDKKLHFFAGCLIAILGSLIFNTHVGIALSIIAGIGKEAYDYFDYGKPDVMDMVVTWLGGFVGFLIITALETL